jgi:imidazolonepropionase-like amidohydrolase
MLIIPLAWNGRAWLTIAEGKRAMFWTIDRAADAPGNAAFSRRGWLLGCLAMFSPLATLVAACSKKPARQEIPYANPLRIDNVTVVDPSDGSEQAAMSIFMNNGTIISVLPTDDMRTEGSATTVDGRSRFAVPGYNNMHSHALIAKRPELLLATMLAEGVTGFRQMSGSAKLLKARAERRLPLGVYAPDLLVMPGDLLLPFNARSPEEARAQVNRQHRQHADFIKIILLPRAAFFAAIDEAERLGLPTAGHLPPDISPSEASTAGFGSIEHFGTGNPFWLDCSVDHAALWGVKTNDAAIPWWVMRVPLLGDFAMSKVQGRLINPTEFDSPATVALRQRALDSFDIGQCRALAQLFRANTTWQVPTLVRLRTQELADLPEYQTDPALANMSAATKATWHESTAQFHALAPAMRATFRETYQQRLAVIALWDAERVPMMTGTDGKGDVPGQALQQEFRELAKAGLSPLKILQMTTVEPARFLGRSKTMGRIAPGMTADVVLLEADPRTRVENLGSVSAVVRHGRYMTRSQLDQTVVDLRRAGNT